MATGINLRKKYLIIIAIIIAMTSFLVSCNGDKNDVISISGDPAEMPTMRTDSVDMTISSDSGYLEYHVITPVWEIYDSAKEPYSFFPEGVHVENYDTLMNIVATVDADTAWYYDKKRFWKLAGNVRIQNPAGEKFMSEEFYWDGKKEKVYSSKFVTVERPNKITLYGVGGFEADQQFTNYTFFKVVDSPVVYQAEEKKTDIPRPTDELQDGSTEKSAEIKE
ncbi:LPS export ABC transporter periplasmic protein LptC [Dysgonomonas sp. 25]|uniref:LPS export ABC transporter periplasmic protein LptC n=1 Tax=Dysgonomonas sp. 25 TaxID=2302933 RepID=UPI0013D315DC|nr:LPS export ABC transporter periplasmic protein LptC [Dysgonomonas sp. 25]NDV68383.1 LPS export ABC transporter periplasmic protein LptC [Dysgonomonas sp. 25]